MKNIDKEIDEVNNAINSINESIDETNNTHGFNFSKFTKFSKIKFENNIQDDAKTNPDKITIKLSGKRFKTAVMLIKCTFQVLFFGETKITVKKR